MKTNYSYLLLLFFWLFLSLPSFAQKEKTALNTFLQSAALKQAGVSLSVWNLTEGKPFLSHNEQLSLVPASLTKLISTAAALDYLGENFQLYTPVYYSGNISSEGVLTGDLIIEGRNDPSFGSQFSEVSPELISTSLLKQLNEIGIKSVRGQIIVDDLSFRKSPLFSPKWMWEDLGNYYAPGVYGISFMDNSYELTIRSGTKNEPAKITKIHPPMNDLVFENQIQITNTQNNDVFINGIPYSTGRMLNGSLKENQTTYRCKGEIPDPALFLARWLTAQLKASRIPVSGEPITTRIQAQTKSAGTKTQAPLRKRLTDFKSPELKELIKVINYRSNNHYAEHLLTLFEKESGLTPNEYWQAKGMDTSGQFLYDGSGLSPANALSTHYLTSILTYMRQSKYSESFYRSLPIAGREGTVASFLKSTTLEGKARIKSGSMSNVQAYAGYIEHEGKSYAFALIVTNYTDSRAALRKQMERLLCGLF